MMQRYTPVVLFSFMFILNACQEQVKNPSLALFEGGTVTQDEYIDLYLESTIYKPDVFPTEENLLELVDRLAMKKIVVLEARTQNVDTTKLFQVAWESSERKKIYQYYVQHEIIPEVITDSLVHLFYDDLTPQYRMAYIMRPFDETSTQSFISSQKDSINFIYQLLHQGGDFKDLAKKYSQETSTKDKGGDLGFVIRESLGDKKLREVMDHLDPFSISKPFKGYNGFYILYKGEKRDVDIPPFEETAGQIWETLYRTRRHDIRAEIKKKFDAIAPKFQYHINKEVLNKISRMAGGKPGDSQYATLNFSLLSGNELSMDAATYKGGTIKVYEMFPNPKTAPINMFEFNTDLYTISQHHLFALEARDRGLDTQGELKKELADIYDAALRGIFYQTEVRDKAQSKFDSLKSHLTAEESKTSQDEMRKTYFDIEKKIKTDFENRLKDKYRFAYNNKYFDQALDAATEKKQIQNQEREKEK